MWNKKRGSQRRESRAESRKPPERRMADKTDTQPPKTSLPLQVIDRPDVEETFVDSIGGVIFEGQTLRIDGHITRFDRSSPTGSLTARRYTSCRLVLAPAAAVDLMNQLQMIANQLVKTGVLKQTEPPRAAQEDPKKTN
jgi:hypothetical protein